MCYTNDVDNLSDMLLSVFFFFNGNVYITIYINICKRYRAIVSSTCINTWVGHPRTRVAEAVEMRGGKVVFKI